MSSSSRVPTYKLVVLGEPSIGKTALTLQMCLNHFVETYDPTIEDSYRKQVHVDEKTCILEILDTAGQEEYLFIRDQWIRDGEGFMLVYSVTSRMTFDRILPLVDMMSRIKEAEPMPIILVGNKCDRESERQVSVQEGKRLANGLHCPFLETSAKLSVNVEESFLELTRQVQYVRGDRSERPRRHGPPAPSADVVARRESAAALLNSNEARQGSHVTSSGKSRNSGATGMSGFSANIGNGGKEASDTKKGKKDCIIM